MRSVLGQIVRPENRHSQGWRKRDTDEFDYFKLLAFRLFKARYVRCKNREFGSVRFGGLLVLGGEL